MGKQEVKWSLHTSDQRTAERLIPHASSEVEAQFEAARRRLNGGKNDLGGLPAAKKRILRMFSEEQALRLARRWLIRLDREQREWWEEIGRKLEVSEIHESLADLWHQTAAITGEAPDTVAPTDLNDGRHELKLFLAEENATIQGDANSRERFCTLLREARLESIRRAMDRIRGEPFQCYDPRFSDVFGHSPEEQKPSAITIEELGEKYIAELATQKAPKTLLAYRIHTRLLSEILGAETPINEVGRPEVEAVCEILEKMPSNATKRYPGKTIREAISQADAKGDSSRLASNSRRNYFFNMFSVFGFAVEIKQLAANPFDDRYLKQRFTPKVSEAEKEETAISFTVEELNLLFHAPLYTGCQDDKRGYKKPGPNVVRRGRFWVPIIALFHGLRLNEICQLYSQDVKRIDGELIFEVRSFLDGGTKSEKRLKNEGSTRTVPIHPELLKMGFEQFVNIRKHDATSPRLFPELRPAKKSGSYSDVFSKWFLSFAAHAIGKRTRPTFHGFRHGWRDALREADVSPERVKRLGGWREEGEHANYGRAKLVKELKAEISKVRYEGLDLTHLRVRNYNHL